jgi:hypothetical protein
MKSSRRKSILAFVVAVPLATALTATPDAAADPTVTLTQAVLVARSSSSKCPALQQDPLVQRGAEMANQATGDYINQRSAAVPFTDPLPVLTTIGYTGTKAVLLSGYGPTEADALKALMLQYQAKSLDCSYTQFGVDAVRDGAGFNLASVILTEPAH